MTTRTLCEWIEYIQTLHAREIDLTLDRVESVYRIMYPKGVPYNILTIAGTNGKGSTAELAASVLRASGSKVGKYTSPHLIAFNERFNIDGQSVSGEHLLRALQDVELARGDTRLTFFEYGTLAAIHLFAQAEVDVAVMEVGLGGRLDAVNILTPDVTIITNIAIDHTAWLGSTIEAIATEKFGITRANIICVIGASDPPKKLLNLANKKGVPLRINGRDHRYSVDNNNGAKTWRYESAPSVFDNLPLPFLQGGHQLDNAAAAIAAVQVLLGAKELCESDVRVGIGLAKTHARSEIVSENPMVILDVAHNVASVRALATRVNRLKIGGNVIAVCGMLADKEIERALAELAPIVDVWHVASIRTERGASSAEVRSALEQILKPSIPITEHDCAQTAYQHAMNNLNNDDCLLVFGSFMVTGDILAMSKV